MSASRLSFKPPSVVCLCGGGAWYQSVWINCSRGWPCADAPVVLGVYTPSSMPMKSEPFCIVMEAPAALSTNMEVYWPACGEGDRQPGVSAEQRQTCICLCAPPTCSSSRPCTLTVNILLLLSNPTIISSELQSKRNGHKCKQKHIFIFNQYSCP